jgi:hypothetical protein
MKFAVGMLAGIALTTAIVVFYPEAFRFTRVVR